MINSNDNKGSAENAELLVFLNTEAENNEDLTPRQVKTLKLLNFDSFFDDNLILSVNNSEEKLLLDPILEIFIVPACNKFYNKEITTFIKVDKSAKAGSKTNAERVSVSRETFSDDENNGEPEVVLPFDKEKTFSSFIVGRSNKVVFAACERVAENPGIDNPLYIYGKSGIGKTHLLTAIANETSILYPDRTVTFVDAEEFVDDYVFLSRHSKMPEFYNKYVDTPDVLLVDDFQDITEKMEGTKDAFFTVFGKLVKANKQIIISSDVDPDLLGHFHNRMLTRLKSGLYFGMDTPEIEIKINYIKRNLDTSIKNEEDRALWTNQIIKKIALSGGVSIRELAAFLSRIIFHCDVHGEKISESIIDNLLILNDMNTSKEISPAHIVDVISDYYNISSVEIKSSSRAPALVKPRHIAMYLCRKITPLTTTQIGKFFNRDHSAIVIADKKIKKLINEDQILYNELEKISELLNIK